MTQKKFLIIEDDLRLVEMLKIHFNKHDWLCEHAADGEEGLNLVSKNTYDLIILDRDLPGLGGIEICKKIRKEDQETRILMLTAFSDELDLVIGLDSGADDYVGKPFKLGELIARIQALLRRNTGHSVVELNENREFKTLRININERKVYLTNNELSLTAKEFDLLVFLSAQPGRVFSRTQILNHVWGSNVLSYEQSINTIVKRLRKKIEENPSKPIFLETVRGVGYRFSGAE